MISYVAIVGLAVVSYADAVATPGPLPVDLTGVWATDDAVLDGALVQSGGAFYFDGEGRGFLVGGPPPIGAPVEVSFSTATNRLTLTIRIPDDPAIPGGTLEYDSKSKVLKWTHKKKTTAYTRRFKEFTKETRKALTGVSE
jgi:hypothetical protein